MIVDDLACSHQEAGRALIGDVMMLRVHTAFRSADQAVPLIAWPSLFDRRPVVCSARRNQG